MNNHLTKILSEKEKNVDLTKMIKTFEKEGYIDYWTEKSNRIIPKKVK